MFAKTTNIMLDIQKIQIGHYLLDEKGKVIRVGPHWFTMAASYGRLDKFQPIPIERLHEINPELTQKISAMLAVCNALTNAFVINLGPGLQKVAELKYIHEAQILMNIFADFKLDLLPSEIIKLTEICQNSK